MDSSAAASNMIGGNYALTYSANDWFYMKSSCAPDKKNAEDCSNNQNAVQNLRQTTNELGASMTQFNDAKMLYNRELLFTVNMLIGLGLICYYIYLNQDVFPDPSEALQKIGSMTKTATSSSASIFSMAPKIAAAPTK